MAPPIEEPAERRASACPCPACGAALPVGVVPARSIVLCARCCATLLWDGVYSLVTEADIAALKDEDRARLVALSAAQHVNIESQRLLN